MTNVSTAPVNTLTESLRNKVVVTDTSSLLMSGISLLSLLEDCHFVIPAVVVSELESKRSNSSLMGYLAREWLRLLEDNRVRHGSSLSSGVPLEGYSSVTLRVEPNHSAQASLPTHLQDGSHDSTILAVARNLQKDEAVSQDVVLLSNDMPMRLHATLDLGLEALEYNATQVLNAKPFDGVYTVELSDEEVANHNEAFAEAKGRVKLTLAKLINERIAAEAEGVWSYRVRLTNNGVDLANLVAVNGALSFVHRKTKAYGITAKTPEQDIALTFLQQPAAELPIVSVIGGAGTGKTLLTVASALDALKNNSYEKVVVFRSLHEMGQGQEMGFLPGNVDEKMEAWAGAILDAVDVLARAEKPLKKNATMADREKQKAVAKKLRDMIEVQPITYLRGRSLSNTFIILDEAQNFSRVELLNIISRVGEGSKIVLLGDSAQVDNKFLASGKDADIWSIVTDLKTSELFAHVTLSRTERSRVAELASSLLEKSQA